MGDRAYKEKSTASLTRAANGKLQLVITTIGSPEILVLDEPTAGLDPSGRSAGQRNHKGIEPAGLLRSFISSHVTDGA